MKTASSAEAQRHGTLTARGPGRTHAASRRRSPRGRHDGQPAHCARSMSTHGSSSFQTPPAGCRRAELLLTPVAAVLGAAGRYSASAKPLGNSGVIKLSPIGSGHPLNRRARMRSAVLVARCVPPGERRASARPVVCDCELARLNRPLGHSRSRRCRPVRADDETCGTMSLCAAAVRARRLVRRCAPSP